jgi:hypothetical protein
MKSSEKGLMKLIQKEEMIGAEKLFETMES